MSAILAHTNGTKSSNVVYSINMVLSTKESKIQDYTELPERRSGTDSASTPNSELLVDTW